MILLDPKKLVVWDFETYKIEARPAYPPKPVGLAWHFPDTGEKDYCPCRSPSEYSKVKKLMQSHLRSGRVPVMHNASFDLDVAETHLGLSWPAEHHDTLLTTYLDEPRAMSFSLKSTAERVLGVAPKERDELRDWILANVKGATKKSWGAYISEAPFDLVRPYAIQDTVLPWLLIKHHFKNSLGDDRMQAAYRRELKVTRVLVKMERRGVPVAVNRLRKDVEIWKNNKSKLEASLLRALKVPKKHQEEFPWSGPNFAKQLVDSGLVAELPLTQKGNPSTSAENLAPLIPPKIGKALELRSQLQTCIATFAEPWIAQAKVGGFIYARFNQVRQDSHGADKVVGTTTGRLSMTPNLQNVIRSDKGSEVPALRSYMVPGKGWWWLKRDYSQQEFRIFAHYEEGELLERYKANPKMDAHVVTGQILYERAAVKLERRAMKDVNFGVIYGMGAPKMALKLKVDETTGRNVIRAYYAALPGVKDLRDALVSRADAKEPIYTWGGRRYFVEEPKMIDGRLRTFEYKLLNLLVQGSAADATKEAMVRYDDSGWNDEDRGPLLMQVHDELDARAPFGLQKQAMHALRRTMESLEFDVPLLSDGSASKVSWDAAEDVDW